MGGFMAQRETSATSRRFIGSLSTRVLRGALEQRENNCFARQVSAALKSRRVNSRATDINGIKLASREQRDDARQPPRQRDRARHID